MGVSRSKTIAQELKINELDWEYLSTESGVQIVKHRQSDLLGEVAVIVSDPLNLIEDELDIYSYRQNRNLALVSVYCAQYLNSSQATMCGNQQNIKVIYERITHRYYELPLLTLEQSIYALSESLRGFQECYQKVSSFELNERMFGINSDGNIKVWLNENFAQNHPSIERPSLQITVSASHKTSAIKQQAFFVRNLIEIIRSKVQQRKFPPELQKALKNSSGFYQTYNCIEKYCSQNKLWIPDRIIFSEPERLKTRAGTVQRRANINYQSRMTNKPSYTNTYVPYPIQNTVNRISDYAVYQPSEFPSRFGQTSSKVSGSSNVNPIRLHSRGGSGISFKPI